MAAPLNDAIVGLALTPVGGVSAAVGLERPFGATADQRRQGRQSVHGNGDIPTTGSWSGARPGFFLGLAVDSRVADALSSRFKGGGTDDSAKKSGGRIDSGKDSKSDSGGDSS